MATRGEISGAEAKRLQQSAARLPSAEAVEGPSRRCHTDTMRAVRRWVETEGIPVLKSPPPPFTTYLESEKFPLRVHYNGDEYKDLAQQTLTATEDAWQKQVVEDGYPAPYTGPDKGPVAHGLWTYIAETGIGAAGYMEPLFEVAETPASDCSVRVVIDRSIGPGQLPSTVAHEFNHATQATMDCVESISAWEGFASAVESHYFAIEFDHQQSIGVFQRNPDLSLDFWTDVTEDTLGAYQYGAMIFPFYLQERFGGGSITFLRDLWKSFAQNGTVAVSYGAVVGTPPNGPDWFEATDQVLQKSGSSFDDAFDEFSVWRAVSGNYDDKAHFTEGKRIPSVQVAESKWLKAMPLTGKYTTHEYGSSYLQLYPTGYAGPVHVQVSGDPTATWGSSLLLWRKDQPVQRIPITFTDSKGDTYLSSVDGLSRILLVVSQHKDQTHDPDEMDYDTTRSFDILVDGEVDPDAGPVAEPLVEPTPEPAPELIPEPMPEAGPESGPTGDSEVPDLIQADASVLETSVDASGEPTPTDNGSTDGCGCAMPGRSGALWPLGVVVGLAAAAFRRRKPSRPSGRHSR